VNDSRIIEGMKRQLEIRRARLDAGDTSLGWKVGFGAPIFLEKLGIDAPLVGFLTGSTVLEPDVQLSVAGWAHTIAEPEIAVYLGDDLSGEIDRDTARAAITAIGPIIELAEVTFPANGPDDVQAVLVENIYNRHVILGQPDESRAGCNLDGLLATIHKDGELVAETRDPQANTGDYIDIVRHIAKLLPLFGEHLRAGEIIITGSIVPPIPMTDSEEIRFSLEPIGAVAINPPS
jgi:2-keto-4-pentenoate hydratase